jgi:hypothetical protein
MLIIIIFFNKRVYSSPLNSFSDLEWLLFISPAPCSRLKQKKAKKSKRTKYSKLEAKASYWFVMSLIKIEDCIATRQ